jgi:cell division protein FtsW (lipid II flippase)
LKQADDIDKFSAPKNGDFVSLLHQKSHGEANRNKIGSIWTVFKFILALLALPLVILVKLLDWAHLIVFFALGAVCLYAGVVNWQSNDWTTTLVAVVVGLALTFGVILFSIDKVRGRV